VTIKEDTLEKTTKPRTRKAAARKADAPTILAIKGMNHDMTCRSFKFEPGQSYEVSGRIAACENGFHSCPLDGETSPLSVFQYYAPGISRYFEVEASGETDRQGDKIASAKLTIGVEVGVGELTRRFVDWVIGRAKPYGAASNSGDYGAASNSGYSGAASNSGARGAAFSHAYGGKVMCEDDEQALYCTEFASDGAIVSVACGITGRAGIEAGKWYVCKNGQLAEAA
jgi:hypothetical protein